MLRSYRLGDVSLTDRLVIAGLRQGLTLSQLRDDSLPWERVSAYLHLLNPAILPPKEAERYKQEVILREGWDPGFVNRYRWFVAVSPNEWWCSWPENMVTMNVSFATYRADQWRFSPSWDPVTAPISVRLSFWGSDDFGMELDMGPPGSYYPQMPSAFSGLRGVEQLIRSLPYPLTQDWLRQQGFIRA